jgi:AcrR family transcriptional regulator
MTTHPEGDVEVRVPLTRDRVLRAAVEIADARGIAGLTMRNLAHELGVEAMSLYHHVANKGEVLDGIADAVVAEVNEHVRGLPPPDGADWKAAVRRRILTARQVLLRHPWAPAVLETRDEMSPAALAYFDALAGQLRAGGMSADLVHHAMHALGSRAFGFTQELFSADPNADPGPDPEVLYEQMAGAFPNIAEIIRAASHDGATTLGWCDDQFEFGLDIVLDGLERLRRARWSSGAAP